MVPRNQTREVFFDLDCFISLLLTYSASESEVLDGRIHQADAKEKRRRLEYVLNRFGDEPQPVLERVTYTVRTNNTNRLSQRGILQWLCLGVRKSDSQYQKN